MSRFKLIQTIDVFLHSYLYLIKQDANLFKFKFKFTSSMLLSSTAPIDKMIIILKHDFSTFYYIGYTFLVDIIHYFKRMLQSELTEEKKEN